MSEQSSQEAGIDRNASPATDSPPALQIGNVLKIVMPAVLIVAGAFAFFGVFDGRQWISNLMRPARVPVTGRVLFNGEPLPGALVFTQPVKSGLKGALTVKPTDDDGRFTLFTEIAGTFRDGAFAGEHYVKVEKRHDVPGGLGPSPLMTPDKYAAFGTSGLRITVSEGAEVTLELEGDPQPVPGRGRGPVRQRPPEDAETQPDGEEEEAEPNPEP